MESLDRCRIILGLSKDNTPKLELVQVFLEKAREDIEAFCRDNFHLKILWRIWLYSVLESWGQRVIPHIL